MEITGKTPPVNMNAYVKNVQERGEAHSGQKDTSQKVDEDKVVLSPQAREVQDVNKKIESVPDIREDKIAPIKKQIENGTYKVEGDKIAIKMLKDSIINEIL